MADFTLDDIEKARKDGLLSNKEVGWLKQDLIERANQEEATLRKFIGKLSHEITEGWQHVQAVGGKKEGAIDIVKSNIEGMVGALQILTALPTAAGQTLSEPFYSWLVKRGANRNVAALAAGVVEITTSMAVGSAMGKPYRAAKEVMTESNKAAAAAQSENIRKGLVDWMEQTVFKDKMAQVAGAMEKDVAASTLRKEQNVIIEAVNRRVKNVTDTQKLLDKAAQATRGATEEVPSTQATLQAAYETMLGKEPAEAIAHRITQNPAMKSAVRQLDKDVAAIPKTAATKVVRGGAPTAVEEIGATARARQAFEEGAAQYEAHKINLTELQAKARESKTTLADVINTKYEPTTPQRVVELSQPIRESGENFIKLVGDAEKALEHGDYGPFHRALAEFNFQVKSHWPYMAPRQIAGQTLRVYDEPVLSSTHYLQQLPVLSSWMAKLKMRTPEEVEANAQLILREMQKIKSPSHLTNFAKKVADEMSKGDEVLDSPTFRDYARFYFVNSIMSGTDTISRNLFGNVVGAPWHYADKITSSVAARILNPFLSAEHHIEQGYIGEANKFMAIWSKSLWDASRYALTRQWDKVRGLVPDESALLELMGNRYDLKKFATTGTSNPFTGRIGQVIGTPVGIAQAADEVSRIAFYRAAVGERLYHDWIATSSKIPFSQYLEEGFANVPPSMHSYGVRVAQEFTWSDKLSQVGKAISTFMRMTPGSEFVQPFIRTPDRLTASIWNHSPVLNLASKRLLDELRSGDEVVRAEAVGRVLWTNIVGAGLFMWAGNKAPDGMSMITGGGPTNRELAGRLAKDKIFLPYTIWTPLGRIAYHYLQPAAGPIGMIADARGIWDGLRTPDAGNLWWGTVLAMQRNIFDTTYTKQLADFAAILDNPTEATSWTTRFATNIIGGFVEPAIVRQVLHEFDPELKEAHGFWDYLARDVPGYGLPAQRNMVTGEPIIIPPRAFNYVPIAGWVLPTSPMQPTSGAMADKIRELGITIPQFYKAFGGPAPSQAPFAYQGPLGEAEEAAAGIPIPDELRMKGVEYMNDVGMWGNTLTDEGNAMVVDPGFQKLAPIDQAEQIKGLFNSRMSASRERIKMENPELLDQLDMKLQKRAEVRMPNDDRDAFIQTINPPPEPYPTQFVPLEGESGMEGGLGQ